MILLRMILFRYYNVKILASGSLQNVYLLKYVEINSNMTSRRYKFLNKWHCKIGKLNITMWFLYYIRKTSNFN